eukprot:g1150.t1
MALVVNPNSTGQSQSLTMPNGETRVVNRSSNLKAPTMLLSGHSSGLNCCKFSPDGQHLATAGGDHEIFLWNVYGDCENYAVLKGHKNVIQDIVWPESGENIGKTSGNDEDNVLPTSSNLLFSASADKTIGVWDVETGERLGRLYGHKSHVNSLDVKLTAKAQSSLGPYRILSVCDGGELRIWDLRQANSIAHVSTPYPLLACCWAQGATTHNENLFFVSGVGEDIHGYDMRKLPQDGNDTEQDVMTLEGHTNNVTSLACSPDGRYLLSNGMDNVMYAWDIAPFVQGGDYQRCVRRFTGHKHGFDKSLLRSHFSPDGSLISTGSFDHHVYIFDFQSGELVYALPGHTGTVTEVAFHPNEPVLASVSMDTNAFLGELELEG